MRLIINKKVNKIQIYLFLFLLIIQFNYVFNALGIIDKVNKSLVKEIINKDIVKPVGKKIVKIENT